MVNTVNLYDQLEITAKSYLILPEKIDQTLVYVTTPSEDIIKELPTFCNNLQKGNVPSLMTKNAGSASSSLNFGRKRLQFQ